MTTASDMKALDLWHAGLPHGTVGTTDDTTLDVWSDGEPVILYAEDGGAAPPSSGSRPVVFVCT